jgi:hypothetical protein
MLISSFVSIDYKIPGLNNGMNLEFSKRQLSFLNTIFWCHILTSGYIIQPYFQVKPLVYN